MSYVNIRDRKCAAVSWLLLFVFVYGAQAVDAFAFHNVLQHLTNWAWLFHGTVAAARALSDKIPHVFTLLAFGIACFVTAGIASIQIMDNSMIETFEREIGSAVVQLANFIFHYLPPIFWAIILVVERKTSREFYATRPWIASITQTIVVTLMFTAIYSLLFSVQDQYPGSKIDFTVLFSASAGSVVAAFGVVMFLAVV